MRNFRKVPEATAQVGRAWNKLEKWPWRKSIQQGLAPVSVGLLLAGTLSMAKTAVTGWTTGGNYVIRAVGYVMAQDQSRAAGSDRGYRWRNRIYAEIKRRCPAYRKNTASCSGRFRTLRMGINNMSFAENTVGSCFRVQQY